MTLWNQLSPGNIYRTLFLKTAWRICWNAVKKSHDIIKCEQQNLHTD